MSGARKGTRNYVDDDDAAKALVRAQYARVLEESTSKKLRVEEGVAGELVAKSMVTLNEIDPGIHASLLSYAFLTPSRAV